MSDKPSVSSADVGCCTKLGLLWTTNKPLAIFLLVLFTLINLGIIFLVLWFFVFNKKDSSPAAGTATATHTLSVATAASHEAFLHLRNLITQ